MEPRGQDPPGNGSGKDLSMFNGIGPADIHDKAWTYHEKIKWSNFRNLAYRILSLLSKVLEAVKASLDPSQFD